MAGSEHELTRLLRNHRGLTDSRLLSGHLAYQYPQAPERQIPVLTTLQRFVALPCLALDLRPDTAAKKSGCEPRSDMTSVVWSSQTHPAPGSDRLSATIVVG